MSKLAEAASIIARLADAYRTVTTPVMGQQNVTSYEVSGVLKAIDAIGKKMAEVAAAPASDDIPF